MEVVRVVKLKAMWKIEHIKANKSIAGTNLLVVASPFHWFLSNADSKCNLNVNMSAG